MLIFLLLAFTSASYAQDTIIEKSGNIIPCKITRISPDTAYYVSSTGDPLFMTKVNIQNIKLHSKDVVLARPTAKKQDELRPQRTAGEELQIAARRMYTGMGVSAAGAAFTIFASQKQERSLTILGGVITTAGMILSIESISHIGKAGRLMEKNNVSFKGNGITYAF